MSILRIKKGLFAIANEVLVPARSREPDKFPPAFRLAVYLYRELSASDQYAFDQLYWNFFITAIMRFWKRKPLTA